MYKFLKYAYNPLLFGIICIVFIIGVVKYEFNTSTTLPVKYETKTYKMASKKNIITDNNVNDLVANKPKYKKIHVKPIAKIKTHPLAAMFNPTVINKMTIADFDALYKTDLIRAAGQMYAYVSSNPRDLQALEAYGLLLYDGGTILEEQFLEKIKAAHEIDPTSPEVIHSLQLLADDNSQEGYEALKMLEEIENNTQAEDRYSDVYKAINTHDYDGAIAKLDKMNHDNIAYHDAYLEMLIRTVATPEHKIAAYKKAEEYCRSMENGDLKGYYDKKARGYRSEIEKLQNQH